MSERGENSPPEQTEQRLEKQVDLPKVPEQKIEPEHVEELERVEQEKIEAEMPLIKEQLTQAFATSERPTITQTRDEKIRSYQERHTPGYLKEPKRPWFNRIQELSLRFKEARGFKVQGRENIPKQGPFLIVSNHEGGEAAIVQGLFGKFPIHIGAAEKLNWQRSGLAKRLLEGLRMLPVKESLANLSEPEKTALLERTPEGRVRDSYREIMERDGSGKKVSNLEFVRSAVALLSRGDPVAMFPEGLFTYEKERKMRKAYGGIELIAKEYKRVTGAELPIVTLAVSAKGATVGKPTAFSENKTSMSGTDWLMTKIALDLPESERGYYAANAKELTE